MEEICQVLSSNSVKFSTRGQVRISLTHSLVIRRLKLSKKCWKHQNPKLLLTLLFGQPNIEEAKNFVLHIAYNRPHKEKSL